MKKILFTLLLFTAFLQAQTYPVNPTKFGKISLNTNGVSTSTNKINTQEADGQINYIDAVNLPVPTTVTNALELKTENSAGAISGFGITNNGNGTVNIASGVALLRIANTPTATLIKFPIPSVTNLALTDNVNNYVSVDYNGGTPAITVTTSPGTINTTTNSLIYVISKVGNTLDYVPLIGQNVDSNAKLRRRFLNSEGLRRASGAVLTGSSRNLVVTAGLYYSGLIEVPTPAFNTSTTETFTQVYENGSTWIRTTGNTEINNTQYNNAGVLTNIPTNDYRVDYVYILANNPSKLYVILGNTTYANITNARLAPVPANLPSELQAIGTRIGRVIIQRLATTMEVSSEFATVYNAGSATLHNDLGGLNAGDFQHLTAAEKATVEYTTNKSNTLTASSVLYPNNNAVIAGLAIKANDADVLHKTGNESKTGILTLDNLKLPLNPIGSSLYRISGSMATNDTWSIYGADGGSDKGELVFEVGDSGGPYNNSPIPGERFRFHYDASNGGIAKDPVIIDYNDVSLSTNLDVSGNFTHYGDITMKKALGSIVFDPMSGLPGGITYKNGGVSYWSFNQGAGDGSDDLNIYNFTRGEIDFSVNDTTGEASFPNGISSTSYTGEATLTGTPTAPTASVGTNTTQIATTAFVQTAITNNGIITTATNITNATLTDSSLPQNGKTLLISNGSSNINYTVNGIITASFVKGGTGSITFVQGSGRTMIAANGTLVFNGAQYSTASVVSFGTTDIVYINNF